MNDFQGLMMEPEVKTQEVHNEITYPSRVWSFRNRLEMYFDRERFSGSDDTAGSLTCAGGETAEMPGMYGAGQYDIAGFALGVVERSHILPKINDITVGDIIIGLPSNGVHSNGFSLIHKLMNKTGLTFDDKAPFSVDGLTLGEELIKPTRIYVRCVLPALQRGKVKAVAHVTGGGLLENIPRVIPASVRARLNAHWWNVHPVFAWIADAGSVQDDEMLRTFNCGIGMVMIISPEDQAEVMNTTRSFGAMVIGTIQARPSGGVQVVVDNFSSALDFTRRMPLLPKKKVAVLVSGNGSNLQTLIDTTRDPAHCMCCDISLIVSNKADAFAVQRAKDANIPVLVLSHKEYKSREEFDRAITSALEAHQIDIVCLAGYMRMLSTEFVQRWRGRLLNIHPSLLPRHPGLRAQQQCLDAGDKESGCTVHFVDEGMDTGAIVLQERVPVLRDDTVDSLTARIHQAEHRAFPRALRLLASGRVRLANNGTVVSYH
ncbi:Trifunctional purine biosynthetic protein adenosine-3 [Eumeta japonica]|uniref:Phosphoribosylformylglycinamidine cyclo-ligase n=1 Tax=Eumeta variegata TaxID=151549 RepID=A0A4C1Y9Y8_EUMVA|nr:Trifunctional purine biosynthetic protein adenosine-3 [Eumeta japonica]